MKVGHLIEWLRECFCGTWCLYRCKKARQIGYDEGYDDGWNRREKAPPVP